METYVNTNCPIYFIASVCAGAGGLRLMIFKMMFWEGGRRWEALVLDSFLIPGQYISPGVGFSAACIAFFVQLVHFLVVCGSCVRPPNKIGHPAGCRFPC